MAIKTPALILEARNRKTKKKKETTPIKKEITKTVTSKGTSYKDKSTISTKPTVQKTMPTNKERLTSNRQYGGNDADIRTVKTKPKQRQKASVATYDVYERDGNYYYKAGKKEYKVDPKIIKKASESKKEGVIGRYDTKGKFSYTDERGNAVRKEKNLIKKAEHIGKTALVNVGKGTTSIADAGLQEVQNDLKKGEKLNLETKDIPKQYLKALLHANPIVGSAKALKEAKKNIKETWKDDNKNLWQKGVGTALEVLDAGTSSQLQGTKDIIQTAGSLDNSLDEKTAKLQKKIDKPINKQLEKLEKENEKYDDVTNTIAKWYGIAGNMTPGIAASAITRNPNIGIATTALSAKGQATERALQSGMDLDTATKIGTATGLVEAGTEKISGGLKIFGKGPTGKWLTQSGIADDLIEGAINSKIKNQGLNFIAKQGFGILGEVGEEVISDLAGVAIDKGTIDPNAKYSLKDFLDTVKDTAGSTALINLITGGYSRGAYRQNNIDMQNYETKQAQVNEVEQRVASGEISPEKGKTLVEQVEKGTYEQNKALDQIANQKFQEIQQAVINQQMTPQQGVEEMQVLDKTLTSEREKINNPEKYTEKIKTDVMKIAEEMAKDPSVTKEEFVKDWYSEQGEQELGITKQEVENLYDKTQKQVQEQAQQQNVINENNVEQMQQTKLENRVSGDALLNAQDLINEVKNVGAKIDDNGYITVYHQTTPENAQKILDSGKMTSNEQGVFFSTSENASQAEGRGDVKLEFKIPAENLEIDDLFSNNADVKIPLNGQSEIDVSNYLVKNNNISAKVEQNVTSEEVKPQETQQETTETQQQESEGPEILDKMPTEKNPTIKSVKKAIDSFRKEITDMFAPIYDLAYKKTGNKNLYYTADRILSSDGRAQVDLDANQVDLNGKPYKNFTDEQGNKVAMGFETAYDLYNQIPVKAKNEFIVHQLNIDRWNQGVDQFGIPIQESQQKLEELRKEYENIDKWSENIYQYYRNLGQKMVDNGRVSQEQMNKWWEETPHYVHIQRQVNNQGNTGVSVKNGKVDSDNLIRKVKGGDYAILPIKETTAKFTQNASRAFAFNDFGKEYARTIGTDARGENVDNNTNIDEIFGFEPEFINTDGKGTYTMKIYENGMPVEIPISEDIYNALSPKTIPRVGVLAEATNIYKDLLTNKNPFFGFLRNPIKDAGDMFLYSKHPLRKSLATYVKLFGGRTLFKNTVNGVKAQDIVDFYHNTGNAVHSIYKNGQFETQKGGIRQGIDKALSPIEKGNDFMESMPRITEFWNTIQEEGYTLKDGELVPQKGKTPKKTVEQVIAKASYDAADVTVNFKRGGRTSKTISQNGGIFFNPSVQGTSKFSRNITEAIGDAKAGDLTAAKRLVLRAAGLGVAPAILSAVMYGDDDEYKDIQDYQKDQYYLIKAGDGKWIRIPKGRAVSLFESAARRGIDKSKGEKFGAKEYGQLVLNQIAPNNPLDNNILSPITSAITNKSWSGNKIVSDSMAKRPVEEQFNEKTDELSKKLGKQLGISPMKINYVIDQYSGVLGDLILPQITPKATTGSSNPVMNILRDNYSFNAANSNKSVGNFYDTKNKIQTKARGTNATDKDKLQSKYLGTKAQDMYALYTKKQEIQMDKNLSKKEKYEQALEVQKEINKMAKKATENAKDIKIGKNTATVGNALYYKGTDGDWHKESEKTTEKRKELGLAPEKYYYYKTEESYTPPNGYTQSITSGKYAKQNMAIVDAFNFDTSDYLEYKYKLGQIKAGRNTKAKRIQYVNSLPISAVQKAYLLKTKYKSFRNYDSALVKQINNSNLSSKEKQEIYSYLKLGR